MADADVEAREARKKQLFEGVADRADEGIVDLEADEETDDDQAVASDTGEPPEWAQIPENLKMPAGWLVWFYRFPARYTNVPRGADRNCILWNLTEADEKLAAKRARGDQFRLIEEMAKQMIRAVDGHRADWSGDPSHPGSVARFWTEIGGKCRYVLKSLYLKTHTMDVAEHADFHEHCVTSRSAG